MSNLIASGNDKVRQAAKIMKSILMICCLVCLVAQLTVAQLRIVSYNTATTGIDGGANVPRVGMDIVLQDIGNQNVGSIARPIDVLALQEQESVGVTTQAFVDMLNDYYGAGVYARGNHNGSTLGAGQPSLVYNTQIVELLEEVAFRQLRGTQQARQTLRYKLRPVGYDSDAEFYIFSNH